MRLSCAAALRSVCSALAESEAKPVTSAASMTTTRRVLMAHPTAPSWSAQGAHPSASRMTISLETGIVRLSRKPALARSSRCWQAVRSLPPVTVKQPGCHIVNREGERDRGAARVELSGERLKEHTERKGDDWKGARNSPTAD